jgi:single-strand DNA-binding protein
MAKSLNKVQLIGNVGLIETKRSEQSVFTKISLATTYGYKTTTGEFKEETSWHSVAVYGKLAETCEKFVLQGSKLFIEGRLRNSKYMKDGIERYSTDIVCENIIFLSPAKSFTEPNPNTPEVGVEEIDDSVPF